MVVYLWDWGLEIQNWNDCCCLFVKIEGGDENEMVEPHKIRNKEWPKRVKNQVSIS